MLACDDRGVVRAGYVPVLSAQPGVEVVGEAGNGAIAVQAAAVGRRWRAARAAGFAGG